jgi:NADH:ubiquinone oxidoreductase subunit
MIARLFSWWSGHTIGASYDIKRRSAYVGTDEYGNRYYQEKKPSLEGRKRRYVMYEGLAEPSKVPADWHGWLHHAFEMPPTLAPLERQEWESDHKPNMTGTPYATKPKGSLSSDQNRQRAAGDYDSWSPDA